MMYLTGSVGPAIRPHIEAGTLGVLNTPASGYTLGSNTVWAADNGCYNAATYVGDDRWLAWLDSFTPSERSRCLFATAPDVVGDAAATLTRSLPFLPVISAMGYPAAYVAQDGITPDTTPWESFSWLFLGGSTAWKLGPDCKAMIAAAQSRGVPVHAARINSQRRYLAFAALGCATADGTFLAFGPDTNTPVLLGWLAHHRTHSPLFAVTP